ncbi:unnamed protein product [Caenorhabditis bovis]|uniref:EF-hand domain-containing protein n=1 Tax=Caenorhabditis bovis TaxID=2654633 RepID=A0A8S1EPZ4_9PELO|nr:unnamed protein product [Caenorhabditis bovis]
MASPELAEKLRKRLEAEAQEVAQNSSANIPPPPVIPKKIVENPYVAKSDVSIDDLIFKVIEKKEEEKNNNNNSSSNKAVPLRIETAPVATSPDPRSPPPKVSIQELLEKEKQMVEAAQNVSAVTKAPVVVIAKGGLPRSASPRRQQFVKIGDDGSELEKRLAAQRLKKYNEELEMRKPIDPLDEIMTTEFPGPAKVMRSKESIEEEERKQQEIEDTKAFEELEREIEKMSKSPPVITIPPPPSITPPLPPIPVSPVSPRPKCPPPECPIAEPEDEEMPEPPPALNVLEEIKEEEEIVVRSERTVSAPTYLPDEQQATSNETPVLTASPSASPAHPVPQATEPGTTSEEKTALKIIPEKEEVPPPQTAEDVVISEPAATIGAEASNHTSSAPPKPESLGKGPSPVPEISSIPPPPTGESPSASSENDRVQTPPVPEISSIPPPPSEDTPMPNPDGAPTAPSISSLPPPPDQPTIISASSVPSPKSPPPPPPPKTSTPLASRRIIIPTPQLVELIQTEDSKRSKSPTRPQSPAVPKKPVVSSLGLLCDPDLSIEKPMTSPNSQTSQPIIAPTPIATIDEKELNEALERRAKIVEGEAVPIKMNKKLSLYAEFSEFTRKQIQYFTETFKKYDEDNDNFIDFNELKRMMEKLGEAQTHIALKELIKKVDEDQDGKISQREFLLIFRLAASGELSCSEVFKTLADSIDVTKEGVLGAANFFQAKIEEQTKLSRFEEEMLQEKEERKRIEEEKKERREKFLASRSIFH